MALLAKQISPPNLSIMQDEGFTVARVRTELLSGLTVALALVPEAVAFAFVAGVHPLVGLYAAFMVGLITAVFGGRPGMISGATGALAVVTWLQVVLVCVQLVQTVALLLMPPLGLLIGWAALLLFLWMLTNFVAELHGFKSLGLVFVMILASSLGIVFVFSLVLTILGLGPTGGFNV